MYVGQIIATGSFEVLEFEISLRICTRCRLAGSISLLQQDLVGHECIRTFITSLFIRVC